MFRILHTHYSGPREFSERQGNYKHYLSISLFFGEKIGQCRIATRTPEDIYDSIMTTCEQRIYAREPNEYLFLRNEYESVKNEDKEFYVLVKELKIG